MAEALPLTQLLPWLLVALIGVPLSGVLHELTHILFVWPVASEVQYQWPQQYVEAVVPDTPLRQRWASVAGVSPLIVGVISLLYLAYIGRSPADLFTVPGLVQWGLWVSYSITGGVSDYIPEIGKERSDSPLTDEI